ncbi:tyrosine-protein kinase receptor UFO-like [Dysidea avara]|uniref:tyrosine-protein kinase receptor UFO-like n=1 Tax=Dysidea avara TaxID=196820 RepID=UPI0033248148
MWGCGSLLVGVFGLVGGALSQSVLVSRCERLPRDSYCSDILLEEYYYVSDALPLDTDDAINRIIFETLENNDTCTTFTKTLICFYTYLPCDVSTSKLLPLCDTRCSELDRMFEECAEVTNLPLILSNSRSLTSGYNCSNPRTYFNNIPYKISNTSCSNVTRINFAALNNTAGNQNDSQSGSESSSISGSTIAVIAAVGGIVILAILGICAILMIKGKRKSRKVPTLKMSGLNLLEEMSGNKSSAIKHMLNELLLTIKEKFSDVLIPSDCIKKQDQVGKGAFGVVHKGELTNADGSVIPIASKTITFANVNSIRDLVAESTVMKRLDHPNVLPLLGVCVDPDSDDLFKIILPFMANGDLRSFLKQSREDPTSIEEYKRNINESLLLNVCLDIAKGMEYLAIKRFVHRDLAARNCMVDENYNIRVADFGLTRDIYISEYYRADKHNTLPVKWMALESILDNYFDEKTDVWSYGITCWEAFSLGRVPYAGVDNQNLINTLKDGNRLDKPRLCPEKLFTLMESTWLENPAERPSFADIVDDLNQNIIR